VVHHKQHTCRPILTGRCAHGNQTPSFRPPSLPASTSKPLSHSRPPFPCLPPRPSALQPLRVNPRQRALHAVFRTYLDVMHVQRDEQGRLFTLAAAQQEAAAADVESQKQQASQARAFLCVPERLYAQVCTRAIGCMLSLRHCCARLLPSGLACAQPAPLLCRALSLTPRCAACRVSAAPARCPLPAARAPRSARRRTR